MGIALLGPVGGLEKVAATTSEPVESEPRVILSRAISGRVSAQILPRPRRAWGCAEDTVTPEDAALLESLAPGHGSTLGSGFVWYSSYAQVTNLLTPDEGWMLGSTWTGGTVGGGGRTGDGTRYTVSRVAAAGQSVFLTDRLAVPTGTPVTVSAYVSTHAGTPATLRVREWDAAGVVLDVNQYTHTATVPAGVSTQRAVVSLVTSPLTATVSINIIDPLMVAAPAATLTRGVQPWASGRGCRTAVPILTGEDPQLGVETPTNWARRHARSFTIHELG